MIIVGFKKSSSDPQQDVSAIYAAPLSEKEMTRFTDINYNRRSIKRASWLAWEIRFGALTEAQMDYLVELDKQEAPQMILNSLTYNIEIDQLRIRPVGGSITVIR